jgi:hypothetical protein
MANIFDIALGRWRSLTTNDLPGAGGGSGGDASAANQTTQISLETAIRDRLPVTLGAKGAAQSLAVTLAADGAAVTAIGTPTDAAAAAAGTGDYGLVAGVKRALLNWASLLGRLPASLGSKAASAALPTVGTPFEPVPGSTVSHSVSTTALTAVACTPGEVIRFGNGNSAAVGVRFGDSSVAAVITAATAMDIMPGSAEAFTVPPGATHWSAIMSSGTGTLKTTRGAGV